MNARDVQNLLYAAATGQQASGRDSHIRSFSAMINRNGDAGFVQEFRIHKRSPRFTKTMVLALEVDQSSDKNVIKSITHSAHITAGEEAVARTARQYTWVADSPDEIRLHYTATVRNAEGEVISTEASTEIKKLSRTFDPLAILAVMQAEVGEENIATFLAVYLPDEFGTRE